jgi:hypothetical protein
MFFLTIAAAQGAALALGGNAWDDVIPYLGELGTFAIFVTDRAHPGRKACVWLELHVMGGLPRRGGDEISVPVDRAAGRGAGWSLPTTKSPGGKWRTAPGRKSSRATS